MIVNKEFGFVVFVLFFAALSVLMAFRPRVLPRMTNAYYALIRMKTRVAEEDYDKAGVRIAGVVLLAVSLYVLVMRYMHR